LEEPKQVVQGTQVEKAPNSLDVARLADVVIVFRQSRSSMYPVALRLARAAPRYREMSLDGTKFHIAGFGILPSDLERAQALLRSSGAKDLQLYVNGRVVDHWRFGEILSCYLRSCRCVDWRSHCHKVVTSAFSDEREFRSVSFRITLGQLDADDDVPPARRYLFPRARLVERSHVKLERLHPSTASAQLQALAVKLDCDVCPRFDARAFRELP